MKSLHICCKLFYFIMVSGWVVLLVLLLTGQFSQGLSTSDRETDGEGSLPSTQTPQTFDPIHNIEAEKTILVDPYESTPQEVDSKELIESMRQVADTEQVKDCNLQSNWKQTKLNWKKYIDAVVYINLESCVDRKIAIEEEIKKLNLPPSVPVYRINAVRRKNGAIGCFLSHIATLAKFIGENKNVLILEDDFMFARKSTHTQAKKKSLRQIPLDIWKKLETVNKVLSNRWDVIIFGQFVHKWRRIVPHSSLKVKDSDPELFHALESTTTSGYLVNKHYIHRLWSFLIFKFKRILRQKSPEDKDFMKYKEEFHIDQVQREIQLQHFWIAFLDSIGQQRAGVSTIGNDYAENVWYSTQNGNYRVDCHNLIHKLKVEPALIQRKLAICHVATGKYIKYVEPIQADFHHKFMKGHLLECFLFTDQPKLFGKRTREGSPLHVYGIQRKGFPGDTLYRYHYMLKAKSALLQCDHMGYSDVDYALYRYVNDSHILAHGLVATRHLHELTESRHGFNNNLIGSPETNPKSTAYIDPKTTRMLSYFCGGFQYGTVSAYLAMCETISKNIDEDDANNIVAVYHDESHFNKYVSEHEPAAILSQSYIYPEECLERGAAKLFCIKLKSNQIKPIMLALDKNHQEMRK